MKYSSKKLLPLALTLATLTIVGTNHVRAIEPAQDNTTSDVRPNDDKSVTPAPETPASKSESTDAAGIKNDTTRDNVAVKAGTRSESNHPTPNAFNQASSVIGMTVHNQQGDHLGWIKDLVFEADSQRVAYVVMTGLVTGQNGYNEKLLAVPVNAFTHDPSRNGLILQTTPDRIAMATGLDRDKANWPAATDSSWGAQPFWQIDSRNQDSSTLTSAECVSWKLYSPRTKPDGLIDQQQ